MLKISSVKLEKALINIKDEQMMFNFLKDLTTPAEFKALQERLDIAILLNSGLSYAEISKKTGASTTTVTRVARFLKNENFGGYRYLIKNLDNFK